MQHPTQSLTNTWEIYIDGSSSSKGLGAGIVVISLEGVIAEHTLCLEFPVINNEAEYEVVIAKLEIAKDLGVYDLKVYNESQLIVGQVNGDCET